MSIYVKQSNACQPICRNPEEELNDIRKEVAQLRTALRTELNDDWFIQIRNECYVRLKNGVVSMIGQSLGTNQLQPNQYNTICVVPEKYRPMNPLSFYVNLFEQLNISMFGLIEMNGKLSIYTTSSNDYWRISRYVIR